MSSKPATVQFATVRRYCAIEGIECDKQIPYHGEWTFFFAYPSHPYWRDFSSRLAKELKDRGIYGERWEDRVKGDLIFLKVCDGIYSHDFLLAEVTEPNPNVLLEIGYALAVGRQPILLIDKTRKSWKRHLLTTLESSFYETRDDILEFIAKLQSQPRTIPANPDRRLPLLENTGIFEREESPGTVYHLRPKITTDLVKRVDLRLKRSYLNPTAMDPSDSVYDEFFPQAQKIQESHLIIATLVSRDHTDAEVINANVALLIGFAIGLGKSVLVLQQTPAPPILDLGTVLRPVETESQAEQIVDAWASPTHPRISDSA